MNVYSYDNNGVFLGVDTAEESPLEKGVFLIPANATTLAPPDIPEGKAAVWDGSDWNLQDAPKPPPPPVAEQLTAQQVANMNARMFLRSTDWYVVRKMETGVEIPQNILDKRAAARAVVVE